MEPVGVEVAADQRRVGAEIDRHISAGDLASVKRVARALRQRDIAGDDGERGDAHVRRGERHQDRHRVVGGGVGVDQKRAHALSGGLVAWRDYIILPTPYPA